MGCGSSIPADKKIVIVGAGYGGMQLGLELLKQRANFTVIDAKEDFYHNVGGVRAGTEQDFAAKLFIPYKPTFGDHFKQGSVSSIEHSLNKVILEGGEQVDYDILVIATGSTGYVPFKYILDDPDKQHMLAACDDIVKKVKSSTDFVVIGGGAVGCEVSAELATDYKDAKVTLIHSNQSLIHPDLSGQQFTKFQNTTKDKLKRLGVNLVLGEKVVTGLEDKGVYGPCDITTDTGNKYHADIVFRCTGLKVNSKAYASSLGDSVNSNGTLQVNEFLQVKGYDNIFALGDCTDIQEIKCVVRVSEHVKILKTNLKSAITNQPMKQYMPGNVSMGLGISIGRKDGVGVTMSGSVIPSFLIKMLKSKDLMVAKNWKEMKQKQPK